MSENLKPDWACPKYGDHEHDWLECPECLDGYDQWSEQPVDCVSTEVIPADGEQEKAG